MKRVLPLVLVLWGHHCDEISAVTALVQQRRAGFRAQLVGLDNRNLRGANGVQLVPDLTLSEALAQASRVHTVILSIILSMDLAGLLRYLDDPRLVSLLQKAIDNGCTLVTHEVASNETLDQVTQITQREIAAVLKIAPNPQQ